MSMSDEEEIEYMGRVNRQRTSRHTGTTAPSVPTTSHATETVCLAGGEADTGLLGAFSMSMCNKKQKLFWDS